MSFTAVFPHGPESTSGSCAAFGCHRCSLIQNIPQAFLVTHDIDSFEGSRPVVLKKFPLPGFTQLFLDDRTRIFMSWKPIVLTPDTPSPKLQ